MPSRIILLPLCATAHGGPTPQTESLETVIHSIGHHAAITEREQVTEGLLEKSDAVFLEIIRADDLTFFMELRNRSHKPVLIYGEDVPFSIQIESLSIGADAFLHLPDSPEVLEAKVHAFLRRSGLESFTNITSMIDDAEVTS